ncbi:FHA domain-containing protein [Alienimonas chondri]|uniref:FHA domain-containing protein n=1 Tax=Alienimonas chondri TaxID=2681879 RepID=A0ABX1VIX3_9PLAN|nr:FHA domain-containing protein [Alienimonas chondri]NNJ27712.1 hypothetical protein [Alienimonas chondri]
MAQITLQVLEGLERGTTFRELATPVSIGREDENAVRLNDERVSRFHAKVQEDGGRVILTDLDSTNGTRVNGRPVSARVLRPGDQIAVGRCLLAYGVPEELDRLTAAARRAAAAPSIAEGDDSRQTRGRIGAGQSGENVSENDLLGYDGGAPPFLPPGERPPVPEDLDLVQRAQFCDLLGFAHEEIRGVLTEGFEADPRLASLPDRLPKIGGEVFLNPPAPRPRREREKPLSPEETPSDGGGSSAGASGMPGREAGTAASGEPPRIVPWEVWQRLIRLEMALAQSLKDAAEPN